MKRTEKIKVLQAIQSGRGNIASLMGNVWEIWTGTNKEPGIFTNEVTGQKLTASQLWERKQARPYLNTFETILTY
jgi:hypothetical protein